MKKRQIIILASAIGIILAGYGGCSLLAGQKKAPERKKSEKIIRLVKTISVKTDSLKSLAPLNGKLVVSEKLELFPEVTGKLVGGAHPFRVGQRFKKGEVLLAIDGRESLLNLQAQRSAFINALTQVLPDVKIDYTSEYSTWKTFASGLKAERELTPMPDEIPEKLNRFLAGRNIFQQYYSVKSLEERQSKFTILAPFNGVVTMGNLYEGTLLRSGQLVGEFIRNDVYELEAAVPAEDAIRIEVGDLVTMYLQEDQKAFTGTVVRIAGNVDPASQRVSLYAKMEGNGLKEGIYMEGFIQVNELSKASQVRRNLVMKDSSVFVIENGMLKKKPIQVEDLQGDEALVTGLDDGDVLLNQFIEGAYEGMPVRIEQAESQGL